MLFPFYTWDSSFSGMAQGDEARMDPNQPLGPWGPAALSGAPSALPFPLPPPVSDSGGHEMCSLVWLLS